MLISIIIPALNEETHIAKTLTHTLKLKGDFEILVVDGGSSDQTLEIVKGFPEVRRYCAPKGRALQMNLGAKHAQGEILVFLHADTFLPKEAYTSICELCKAKDTVGGSFRLVMDDPNPVFKIYTWFSRWNLEFFTYGDHAMFIEKRVFKTITGFKPIPFMEDVEIQHRLRREGRFKKSKLAVVTSGRRFRDNGLVFQVTVDFILVMLFKLGIAPERLKKYYPDNISSKNSNKR
jgi:rSAM/selenodomain-associated transferase 2